MNGITIIDRQHVVDPLEGRKEMLTFSVKNSALIASILEIYPNTGNGSFALCLPEGVCKTLIDGEWV